MSDLENKIKEAIQSEHKLQRADFPNQICFSEYYSILKQFMEVAKKNKNEVQVYYCAMHLLALLETGDNKLSSKIIKDDYAIDKDVYNEVLEIVSKENKKYKLFVIKNAVISFTLATFCFILVFCILKYDIFLALALSVIVLGLDLFANGKTNERRYQTKLLRMFQKGVNSNLLLLNEIYLAK